ncbi:MAG: putative baseplate assembly protein, partial [Verrucomicrobia bacterium]|nr:putative baseplate assembly protein [Verrucomicrobiota bacterium]
QALRSAPEVFETMHDIVLYVEHNPMNFYTWGDEQCCLPKGATKATLFGGFPNLRIYDVLIFEEVFGPLTGKPEDADPTRRQAVRLSQAPILKVDPLNGNSITEIEWFDEDALKFPFCISAVTDKQHQGQPLSNISIACGNIVLADHGLSVTPDEGLGTVPEGRIFSVLPVAGDRCRPVDPVPVPPRFRPRLSKAPLTMAARIAVKDPVTGQTAKQLVPFDSSASAASAFQWETGDALPLISLNKGTWQPQRDLFASEPLAQDFVVEVEEDGFASLRFGDGQHGVRPQSGDKFSATYRVGNGTRGNVGAETIVNIVSADSAISGVRNPMPASGGVDPETIEHVRQSAPSAFRVQERAVTPADYAEVAERYPGIQQAAARFCWTGSWRTVFIAVDRLGGLEVDDDFKGKMLAHMERYRMAGQDLEIDKPLYVSLEIEMTVCAKADYFRSDVEAALLNVFSNRVLPDGTRGVFHPDNFSFGQTVYLSPLYAAAMKVEGVAAVKVTTFQRQASRDLNHLALKAGKLTLARLEIARLDNDPNFPEHGVLHLTVEDGK